MASVLAWGQVQVLSSPDAMPVSRSSSCCLLHSFDPLLFFGRFDRLFPNCPYATECLSIHPQITCPEGMKCKKARCNFVHRAGFLSSTLIPPCFPSNSPVFHRTCACVCVCVEWICSLKWRPEIHGQSSASIIQSAPTPAVLTFTPRSRVFPSLYRSPKPQSERQRSFSF